MKKQNNYTDSTLFDHIPTAHNIELSQSIQSRKVTRLTLTHLIAISKPSLQTNEISF